LVVRLQDATKTEHSRTLELWEQWLKEQVVLIAPFLLRYEVTNAVYRSVRFGEMDETLGQTIIETLAHLPINYIDTYAMHREAYEFARRFNARTSYDGHYIALARQENAGLVTADKRLVNIAKHHYPFLQYVLDE
jgi:predicted nucleic acid-binding protein